MTDNVVSPEEGIQARARAAAKEIGDVLIPHLPGCMGRPLLGEGGLGPCDEECASFRRVTVEGIEARLVALASDEGRRAREDERARLHLLLERCFALLDSEELPSLFDDLVSELGDCGSCAAIARSRSSSPLKESLACAPEAATEAEKAYPCERCGKPRSKAEGGTTFTVCEDCWEILHPPTNAPLPDRPVPGEQGHEDSAQSEKEDRCR